jgi:hypothetical protein
MSHWIKMKVDLSTNPKVVRISSALKADRLRTVGALHAVWSLFDTHSEDGKLVGYSPEILDEMIGWKGFSTAMIGVEWLSVDDNYLSMKDYDENNGTSAKKRAQDSVRKMSARKADKRPQIVPAEVGPEKEKSKNISPIVPEGDEQADIIEENLSLHRAKMLFRMRPSTQLDSSQIRSWKKNKGAVETTSEEDWLLLEWYFAQGGEVAEYRRRDLSTLLNNWNGEIQRAAEIAKKKGANFAKKESPADSVPARWREILVDRYPGNFPEGIAGANFPSSFSLLPASVQAEIREHDGLVSEISEAIHATTTKEAA